MIRDRDGKFPALFDAILADTDTDIVLSGVQMPRMNSIMERWVQTCRCELLERTFWNQRHLLHTLRKFEQFYNGHRPAGHREHPPAEPAAPPIVDPDKIARLDVQRRDRLGAIPTNTNMQPDQRGRDFGKWRVGTRRRRGH
jgi:putative transposase